MRGEQTLKSHMALFVGICRGGENQFAKEAGVEVALIWVTLIPVPAGRHFIFGFQVEVFLDVDDYGDAETFKKAVYAIFVQVMLNNSLGQRHSWHRVLVTQFGASDQELRLCTLGYGVHVRIVLEGDLFYHSGGYVVSVCRPAPHRHRNLASGEISHWVVGVPADGHQRSDERAEISSFGRVQRSIRIRD